MSCRIIQEFKRGVTRPSLLVQLWSDADNAPFDLSGKSVVFDMRNIMSDSLVIADGTVTVVDQQNAIVRYDWEDGDLDSYGTYEPSFIVDKDSETEQAFPRERNALIVRVS